MRQEEVILKNFSLLLKNYSRNESALKSAIIKMFEINPKLGIKTWEVCIRKYLNDIKKYFDKDTFDYNTIGYLLVEEFEYCLCKNDVFIPAMSDFANNEFLLDILYTKSPISEYFSAEYTVSYLIRHDRLDEADKILAAIYKNKRFNNYSQFWEMVFNAFRFGDDMNPGMYFGCSIKQPKHICDFCLKWIDKIKDEEEKAGALIFAMEIC